VDGASPLILALLCFSSPFPYFGSPFPYFGLWFCAQRFSPLGFRFDISVPRFPISLSAAVSGRRSFGISFSVLANRRTDRAISGEQAPVFWYFIFFSAALRFYFCCVDFLQSSKEISHAQLWWPLVSDFWAGSVTWAFQLWVRWRESFCHPALLHCCLPILVPLCVNAASQFCCLHLVVAHSLLLE
jgi:hypothetical protein